jgi:Bacterial archaeo-eukaryotic release factor family 3
MIATMLETKLTVEPLRKNLIPDLIHTSGPCITLLLPPYRPGEPADPAAALLKADLQEATRKLRTRGIEETLVDELLEPLRQLSHEDESLAGSSSARVIFRSHGRFSQFELPLPPAPAQPCTVGGCFSIRPILASLALPEHVYVLEVTKKAVALVVCGFNGVTAVELPRGTPETLDAAMGFDAPDHVLVNRSTSGPSTGAMHGVRFGTGSGRETQHAHLHDFYRAVDRGVNELLRWNQAPLVLAGVDEDVAIYRSLSTYSNLSKQTIHGSPGAPMTPAQVLRNAHDIALFDLQRSVALEMAESSERLAPVRFSTDLAYILQAAVEGRVSDLYLDENGRGLGDFDGKVFGGSTNWHEEDLLNVAAVETLLRGGAVYSLPTHWMPNASVAAAAFRY